MGAVDFTYLKISKLTNIFFKSTVIFKFLSWGFQMTKKIYLESSHCLLLIVPILGKAARHRAGFSRECPTPLLREALIGNILKSTTKTNTLFNFSVLEVLSILLITVVNSGF